MEEISSWHLTWQAWYIARILGGPPTAYGRRKVSNAFQFPMQTLTQLSWMFQEHRKIALAWLGTFLPVSCHCYLNLMLVFEWLWYHHNCNWCLNWTGFFRVKVTKSRKLYSVWSHFLYNEWKHFILIVFKKGPNWKYSPRCSHLNLYIGSNHSAVFFLSAIMIDTVQKKPKKGWIWIKFYFF